MDKACEQHRKAFPSRYREAFRFKSVTDAQNAVLTVTFPSRYREAFRFK